MKTGLLDYTPEERDLLLRNFWSPTAADQAGVTPDGFGDTDLPWGMLGNDLRGDCFPAAEAHEVMAIGHPAGHAPKFTSESVLKSYAAYLGVKEVTEENDAGTDPTSGSKFFRHTGVEDEEGKNHRIGAFAFEREPDYSTLVDATYDFGAINLCFNLPRSAEEAYSKGQADHFSKPVVWDYVKGSPIVGGHSVASVARDEETKQLYIISWERPILITEGFVEEHLMVAIAHISHGGIKPDGTNVAGLDWTKLEEALKEVTA